ncbi:ABC transporter substrate-binding protein [Aristaeella hokkaidonensis]|uniref:Peptide ABC transporter substrate-binding protein n=1 Tax=Aristaeella hokkaidonensis TaxID=3046382 RepID=A0AC61MWK1_9FIRM|nr:ABC transporter substrate-binding protein [Aristaeella hokkaidonensis]QUC66981.1 peptide ABC transporter substrate-binding protein [Aristaeella hokkaidonensis]SNT94382.1 oligopeptide transport system substrate-binding protein [Aristaeella hokkaidonensis]
MTKLVKVLSLVLALTMLCGVAFAEAPQLAADAQPEEVDVEAYEETSSEIYELVLSEYKEYYEKAKEADNVSERYALMAIAEAKLFEAAVMIPLESRGGQFAITRVAPRSTSSTLWGNDEDRLHQAVVVEDGILKGEEVQELRNLWNEVRGTGTYEAKAKEYLEGKGYKLTDVYNYAYTSDPSTWDVLNTSKQADTRAIVNTYDGLFEYDNENVHQPALATEMTVSEDGLKYTFKIREGVEWVDSQGRKVADVKADDWVAGMQHMMDCAEGLEYLTGAAGANIVNADAYIAGEITDFEQVGVKALDDYTLEYTLAAPSFFFETMLSYSVFAPMSRDYYTSQGGQFGEEFNKEAETYLYGKDPDHIAYCGPYLVTNATKENTIVFQANPTYWNKDNINIHTINWYYNDGQDALKAYNDFKAGILRSCGLTASSLEQAKVDGLFDDHNFISATDATSFMGFFMVNRTAFKNYNDATVAVSTQTVEQAARTKAAMQNANFRRALLMSLDRGSYEAQTVGEELKYASMINTFTPGNFVFVPEEVTVDINGEAKTFAAGTYYGEIMQAQIDADEFPAKVWDAETQQSSGFDGWYSPENAKAFLDKAVAELAEAGVVIDAENPIYLDLPVFATSEIYANRAEVLKQSIEKVTGKFVIVNRVDCDTSTDWYNAGYYPGNGYEHNFDIYDVSGWGPDYGDPQTYLDNMLPDHMGYMIKCLGIF